MVFNYELFFYHKKSTRNPQQSCNKSTTFATCCTACSITNAEQIAQVDFDYNRKNLNALSIGRGTKEKSGWTWEHAPAGDQLPATNSQRDPTAESQWTSRDAIRFQRKVKAASLLICLVYNSVSYGYVNRSCLSIRLGLTVWTNMYWGSQKLFASCGTVPQNGEIKRPCQKLTFTWSSWKIWLLFVPPLGWVHGWPPRKTSLPGTYVASGQTLWA